MGERKVVCGDNWDGVLYTADGSKKKIMIVMSGSEGGLEHAEKLARFLADNNVPALAFALFKTKHTGKNLDRIPVERVGTVIQWLKRQGYEKIGIEGVSKGAEYSLAAAIEYPEISCVIVKTPSWFYSEGMIKKSPSGCSCWSYEEMELPFTPYKERHPNVLSMMLRTREYNVLELNTNKAVTENSIIPVERIHGPILMFSTKVDTVWPSEESCHKICDRLAEKKFPYQYMHISFDHMSHMMLEYCGNEIKYFIKSEKENPEACAQERRIMGEECLKWISDVWK